MVALGYERTSDPHAWVVGPPNAQGWRSCHIGLPEFSTRNEQALLFFERMVESTGIGSISADMEDARGEGFVVTAVFMCENCGGDVSYSAPFPDAVTAAGLLALGLVTVDGVVCEGRSTHGTVS